MAATATCGQASGTPAFVSLDTLTSPASRGGESLPRDAEKRNLYLTLALTDIPRILGAMDRNAYHATHGCLDRAYWHYRTSDFASQMYQEALAALALVYRHRLPGNRWHQQARLRELVIAGLRFCARNSRKDGSCDDYYPFEHALGAAVFSTNAAAQAYLLLELEDAELRAWFDRRANWIARHQESGRLANHQALAALALYRAGQVTDRREHFEAANDRLGTVLAWQSPEGWFEEYGGADPGYQSVTLDCLAVYQRLSGANWLEPAIRRGVRFSRHFLHPDGTYGGEYGSRGTFHFYPHGMELLAARCAAAADLADGFLEAAAAGRQAWFADDRMFAHRTANLIEAWLDWSRTRPASEPQPAAVDLPEARLAIRRAANRHTVVSAARGGVFKHFHKAGTIGEEAAWCCVASDTGLLIEFEDGRIAASQCHEVQRSLERVADQRASKSETADPARLETLEVRAPLNWIRSDTLDGWKFLLFRLGMLILGRFAPDRVRRLLQWRLIVGRRKAPVQLTRRFEFAAEEADRGLRVTDTIELRRGASPVKRMALTTDLETAYVAASGAYQEGVLQPWRDLSQHVAELNRTGRVVVSREF